MKRDMDLIRLILLEIEGSSENDVINMMIDGYSKEEILYIFGSFHPLPY